ncbi:MAG: hypothetical protein JWL59_4623 [Chthoniobacteraceae bacterium]|nr:hypothetical protein [Chthoniobacteraceae bacterium]
MNKSDRINSFVGQLGIESDTALDPCYLGFFKCFNDQHYYEAHDVLEHLWLKQRDSNWAFFKGLIQIAGAFVHLQKQFLRPDHPKDGRRLHPAVRLFEMGMSNLEPYRPLHLQLDVDRLSELCSGLATEIVASDFTVNPWSPSHPPQIALRVAD